MTRAFEAKRLNGPIRDDLVRNQAIQRDRDRLPCGNCGHPNASHGYGSAVTGRGWPEGSLLGLGACGQDCDCEGFAFDPSAAEEATRPRNRHEGIIRWLNDRKRAEARAEASASTPAQQHAHRVLIEQIKAAVIELRQAGERSVDHREAGSGRGARPGVDAEADRPGAGEAET